MVTKVELAKMIDHSNVRKDATREDVIRMCEEAKKYGFNAVAINSCYVSLAAHLLKGTGVKVCVAIAFPHGSMATEAKVFEAQYAIEHGADELDVVMNIGALKARDYELFTKDVEDVVTRAKSAGKKLDKNIIVKVIIEAGCLSNEEIVKASQLIEASGADFLKNATGVDPAELWPRVLTLMRQTTTNIGIKSSQDMRTFEDVLTAIQLGATRIGTGGQNSIDIIEGWRKV